MSEPILKTDLKPDRRPEDGSFELTIRCNLHCKMCLFRHDDSENADLIAREKTAVEWIDMARQAAEAGTLGLTITGGEPLLRKDFPEIWEGISRYGFILTLYTNATLVTPEVMDLFRRYPPHRIGVTLYGASEETYEKVTGSGNAYNQAIEGIRQLGTLPSLLDFRTTIIKDNLADMDRMEEWVKENYGEDRVLAHTKMVLKPVRGGCSKAAECRLEPEENMDLYFRHHINFVKVKFQEENFDPRNIRFIIKKEEVLSHRNQQNLNLSLYGCDAGMKSYAITWDGKLIGCQVLSQTCTAPFIDGFRIAWDRFPLTVLPLLYDEECLKCENAGYCLSCCATRFAETGSAGGCSPYVCANVNAYMKRTSTSEDDKDEKKLFQPDCQF